MTSLLSQLADALEQTEKGRAAALDDRRAFTALRRALGAVHPMTTAADVALDAVLDAIDRDVGAQLDAILHHPKMLALEGAWRGLKFVVDRIDFRENTRVEMLNCSKEDLLADFEDSPEVRKSGLYKLVYTAEYGPFGGRAYGALMADYTFGAGPQDAYLLAQCAAVGSFACVPFLTGFKVLPMPSAPAAAFLKWNAFRALPVARFVAGTWQRVAARPPHAITLSSGVRYEEAVGSSADRVWLGGANVVAVAAARSYARWRVGSDLGEPVEGLELDAPWSSDLASRLAEFGQLELDRSDGGIRIVSSPTLVSADARPQLGIGGASLTSAEIAMHRDLRGVLTIGRFVQLAKTVYREQIGRWKERTDVERELAEMMRGFAGRGIDAAEVKVRDAFGNVGWYAFELRVRIGWGLGGAPVTLVVDDSKLDKE